MSKQGVANNRGFSLDVHYFIISVLNWFQGQKSLDAFRIIHGKFHGVSVELC